MESFEDKLVKELTQNFTDGASVMARRAIGLIGRFVEETADPAPFSSLPAFVDRVASARPSMYAIARVLHEWRVLFDSAPDKNRESVDRIANQVLRMMSRATDRTVEAATEALGDFHTLMTHSSSSTLRGVIESLGVDVVTVIVTESSPGGEGKVLAQALRESGYHCDVVADEDAATVLKSADVFVVGADAVLKNGDVVNKVGTCPLAEVAHERGVPTIVVAESFKNAPGEVPLEIAPDGSKPFFDLTPERYVTRRIGDDVFAPLPN